MGLNAQGERYGGEGGDTVFITDDQSAETSVEENRAVLRRGLLRTLRELAPSGVRVVLVGPVPEVGWNVPIALAIRSHTGIHRQLEPRWKDFSRRQAFVLSLLAEAAHSHGAEIVLPHAALCDAERCRIEQDGRPFYGDDDHLSIHGAQRISAVFDPAFREPDK